MRTARQSRTVGAREAEAILGISRSRLLTLANSGELVGRLIDQVGTPRHWQFRRSDVLSVLARGNYLRRRAKKRRQKQLWEEYFGTVPPGYTPAFRDGDRTNVAPANLCLLALKTPRQPGHATRRRVRAIEWSKDQIAFLRREYQSKPLRELSDALGVALSTLTRQARRLGLRKPAEYLREQARLAHRLPIGTERIRDHTDTIWIKVALEGRFDERWRPKHHVIWERATGQNVPPGFRVIFKDGDKRNFDPSNLELATREEIFASAFAQFLACPEPIRATIRLARKLQRAAQSCHEPKQPHQERRVGNRKRLNGRVQWSPQMDEALRRDYPTKSIDFLVSTLRASKSSIRNRARRLSVQRLPESIVAEARAAATILKEHALKGNAYAAKSSDTRRSAAAD